MVLDELTAALVVQRPPPTAVPLPAAPSTADVPVELSMFGKVIREFNEARSGGRALLIRAEEEFHWRVDLIAQPDASMRDLLVPFKTLDAGTLRGPGPQLLNVMSVRDSLERSKQLQYVPLDSEESLATANGKKLAESAQRSALAYAQ